MISIHPHFVEMIRDPFCKNEIFEFIPRSVVIENLYAKSLRDSKCLIEELDKDDKTQILALCLARGVKQQRLLGGNPMNKVYFCLLLSVLECLHNYANVMIVFFVFKLVFVPSKAFMITLGNSCLILLKNRNFALTKTCLIFNQRVILS